MKRKHKAQSVPRLRVSKASRNDFADLGLEDAEELETKSKLVLQITD